MTAVRLNTHIRACIASAALKHRFEAPAQKLVQMHAKLADACYHAQYTPKKLELLNSLPDSWVFYQDHTEPSFGGQRYHLFFSGVNRRWNRDIYEGYVKAPSPEDEDAQVLKRRFIGPKAAFEHLHKMTEQFQEFIDAKAVFDEEHKKVSATLHATLAQYTMLNALVKAWPEIEQFIPKVEKDIIQLPAIPVAELNNMLRIAA